MYIFNILEAFIGSEILLEIYGRYYDCWMKYTNFVKCNLCVPPVPATTTY